jgi:hypothetical protein
MEIESRIAETPAEGYKGIAIKLAPSVFFERAVKEDELIVSVYENIPRPRNAISDRSSLMDRK